MIKESCTHLNNATVGRVESSRGLGTIHETTEIRVGNDVTHRVLDRRMLLLFPFTSLKVKGDKFLFLCVCSPKCNNRVTNNAMRGGKK